MPYKLVGKAVYKQDGKKLTLVKKHSSHQKALAHFRALEINVSQKELECIPSIQLGNPYHDKMGRFASKSGAPRSNLFGKEPPEHRAIRRYDEIGTGVINNWLVGDRNDKHIHKIVKKHGKKAVSEYISSTIKGQQGAKKYGWSKEAQEQLDSLKSLHKRVQTMDGPDDVPLETIKPVTLQEWAINSIWSEKE